jgi:hypothetical protein
MRGKILRIKFKTNEDVTLREVSVDLVETMGGFRLNSGSTATALGTEIHNNNLKETEPTTVS